MEPSFDNRNSINDARVSGDDKGVVVESCEKVAKNVGNDGGFDLGLKSEILGSKSMADEKNRANLVGSNLNRNIQSGFDIDKVSEEGCVGLDVGGFNGINLVVDLNCCGKSVDNNGNEMNALFGNGVGLTDVDVTEREGEYKVSDLIWGKVESHPWWPGQIFDPSAATSKARKYYKKDGFLIAYFGDQSFAWNETSKIKPFRLSFCDMEKQSDAKVFCHAVDCALDEVSRRMEFGLACLCLSEEAYDKMRSQVVSNAGIRKEWSRIDGGDEFSTVASFKPAKVVQCVEDLAKDPLGGINRVEFSTVRAQLTAFNRWKGYYQLPPDDVLDGSENEFEDDSGLPALREEKVVDNAIPASSNEEVPSKRRKLNSVPRKPQLVFDDDSGPRKKVRCLSDLMSNGSSSIPNGATKTEKASRKGKVVEVNRPREGSRRSARQLSGSGSILKKETQMSNMSTAYASTDEILSQIRLTATNPMDTQHGQNLLLGFSSDFRTYRLEKTSQLGEDKNSTEEMGVEQSEENALQSDATEVAGFTGIEDSYWTDRIFPINQDEEAFPQPKSAVDSSPKPSKENSSATALILKFTNLESVPSATNLNAIFSSYGPLRETETDVLKKNNCAKVVFERRMDAEIAFSSAGKFSIFGPSLVSYCLDYSPTPRKTSTRMRGRKPKGKGTKSSNAMQFEN